MDKFKYLLGVVLVIGLLSCSDDDEKAANEVTMGPSSFIPQQLTVSTGTTVIWRNTDSMLHTVTSNTGLFDVNLQPGETFSYQFSSAGTFSYECTLHPGMVGTIVVQ
jgi:plastocyanin